MIEHHHTVPGPIALLTRAVSIFKAEGRFYGTLAAVAAGQAIGYAIAMIVFRSQPVWIQLPLQLCLVLLSLLVSAGLSVAIIGALSRSVDGVAVTWAGVGDDLRRSYLPLLGMMILLAVLFGFVFGIVFAVIFGGSLAFTLMDLPTVYGVIVLVIVSAMLAIAMFYVGLRLALASPAVVLGGFGPWEAIKASWVRARGHVLKIFAIYLLMVPPTILSVGASAMAEMGAEPPVDPQDPFAAFNYVPPPPHPIVDAISLITGPILAIISLWIAAAFALLWLHLDGRRTTPALTE